jgi:CBS domain-containing protein
MQVQHILKQKATAGVFSVIPTATVAEVSEILSTRKIGAVLVSKDGKKLDGIISERDVVREIGRRGAAALEDSAEDLMTRDLVTCGLGDTALEVLGMMDRGNFRHMPVVVDGDVIGLVSIRDVVHARLQELAMEKDALTGMIMGN